MACSYHIQDEYVFHTDLYSIWSIRLVKQLASRLRVKWTVLLATEAGTKQEACHRVLHKLINLPLVRNHTDPPQLQHGLFIAETKNAQHFYHAFFFFFATVKLQLLVLPVLKLTFTTLTPHLQQESVLLFLIC